MQPRVANFACRMAACAAMLGLGALPAQRVQAQSTLPASTSTSTSIATPATAPTDPALLARLADLDRQAATINDLSAGFEQEKHSPLLKKPLVSRGTVRAKGAAMLWETAAPQATVMRVDAASLQLLYVEQKVLEIYPVDGKLAQLAASPLPRLKLLQEQFAISKKAESDTELTLDLKPIDAKLAEHVDQVVVTIDLKSGVINQFELTDPDGERTVIRFRDQKINSNLPDSALEIKLPEGVKTVRPLDAAS